MVLGLLAIHLALIPALFVGVLYVFKQGYQEQFVQYVRSDAAALARQLAGMSPRGARLQALLEEAILDSRLVFVEVVDGGGRRLAAAGDVPGAFVEDFFFGQHDDRTYHVALPFGADGALGTVLLGYDETPAREQVGLVYRRGAYLALAYVLLTLGMAVLVGLKLTRPLRCLIEAAGAIAAGAYDRRVDLRSRDEIGELGVTFNRMAAAVGAQAVIFAPQTAPQAKVAQLLMFGARVLLVNGNYDAAFDLCLQASREFGWYCRNTGYNPFTAEGKKTAAFEICEQLTGTVGAVREPPLRWETPDAVFVSVGDGNIVSGLHKGFKDLLALGWIDPMPRLYGVQSEGSAAIYNAFVAGSESVQAVHAATIADSISVDLPRDGLRAVRAARETGGAYLAVPDSEILNAMRELGHEGVFAEPAGAAAYAGLIEAVRKRLVDPEERVVVLITGSGLKDVRAAMQAAGEAIVIEPKLDTLEKAIRRMKE